ncbi:MULTISPECIES: preprotein translocase subunit YajC [Leifsonia]|uniref:Preprotein translocase, YajC subunit n=3 Tax=Leifsonia TaxID=110932 RepID=U2TBT2_LEIAQ|nr:MULTISPECIES: preprotein translocase subunit YajC [Leifsonia]ERK72152.1 preprotein translocase, YajC subunit [Leifsonia aquatica ATCC 14665]MBB2966655.1 preprotein translocase subunit YajC [Leifsonia aquatica]NYK11579.1 preprotein translocase subunit YajC [Leifsonia naganoensis]
MAIDPLTIVMVVILAALIFFMFRNSRKRQKEQAETRSKMVPGAEVMTNFGLYGTLLSVNEDDNTALVETSPGHVIKVHRQVLARVVEPTVAEPAEADADAELTTGATELNEDHAIRLDAPEYGERIDETSKKPGAKSDD